MLGKRVMFTPKLFFVSFRVSRMAVRSASGDGCVNAVRTPAMFTVLISPESTNDPSFGLKGDMAPFTPYDEKTAKCPLTSKARRR